MNDPKKIRTVRWEEMFPEELFEKIREEAVCYLAYGLAEPHGPYNALGLDWLKAYALSERAAERHGGVVAPPFAWHIQERPEFHDDGAGHGWLPDVGVRQPLASSIPADLFYRMVFHLIWVLLLSRRRNSLNSRKISLLIRSKPLRNA